MRECPKNQIVCACMCDREGRGAPELLTSKSQTFHPLSEIIIKQAELPFFCT